MLGDEFQQQLHEFFAQCKALQQKKRNDYTGTKSPLFNYEKSAEIMGVSTALGMLGRMQEKVIRLSLALQGNELQTDDESFVDTCRDVAILAGLIAIEVQSASYSGQHGD